MACIAYQSERRLGSWAAAALAIAALMVASGARADCVAPDFKVLWTYPADGDDEVPTNAQLWVLTSVWSSAATITLNGEPLTGETQSFGSQVIDPGPLEADTDYELELVFNSGEEHVVTIAFHTGTAAAEAASTPEASGHSTAMGYWDHACADVVRAQDCFDTGQDTLLTVAMEEGDAIGWHIQLAGHGTRAVWPAGCGDPGLYMDHQNLPHACFDVRKIAPGGLVSEATQYCPHDTMMSDAAVPEPSSDASVPMDREDAGVVDPVQAGTSGGGGGMDGMDPPEQGSVGAGRSGDSGGAAGSGDSGGSSGAPSSAKSDNGGCSATSQRGQGGATSLACLLGVLAFAIGRRRRAS